MANAVTREPRHENAVGSALTPITVHIYVDKGNKIVVGREPFWVSSDGEEVIWECTRRHDHKQAANCFEVCFSPDASPFTEFQFFGHPKVSSRAARKDVELHKLYKYTVKVPGCNDLDPHGGVTPGG